MDIQSSENSSISAPNYDSHCTNGTKIDSGHGSSTQDGVFIAKIDSGSQESALEQPNPGHSVILQTTKNELVQGYPGLNRCKHCQRVFTRPHILDKHVQTHLKPFVCIVCGRAFARQDTWKIHEKLHSRKRKFVCRGEIPAQPTRVWGCGRRFARADVLAGHFFSQGSVGRACIEPLLDKEVEKTGVLSLPSILLTQYPELKDLDLAKIWGWQNKRIGLASGSECIDCGYASQSLFDLPTRGKAQTECPPKLLPNYGSLPLLEDQAIPSPPLQDFQDQTGTPKQFPDVPETSADSDTSSLKTIPRGDEPDCEGFSRGNDLADPGICSIDKSNSEGRSNDWLRKNSKKTAFVREKACVEESNDHCSDNSEGSLSPEESSSNSSSENGHSITSEGSVLDCSKRALIARLMDEICSSFFNQLNHRPRQHGQGEQSSPASSSNSTEQSISADSFVGGSLSSRRKRSYKEDEDLEDEDDGKHIKRPRNQNSDDGHSARVRYFACPFHKFDPSTYGSENTDPRVGLKYRSCGPPGWRSIGKLKEHLYRKHQTPIHCPRCWTIMETEAALGEHARARFQCEILPQPLRWIPREVCEKLKNRKKAFAGQTEEDTWRYIFGLLFPDCPNVPNPYYDDGTTLEEMTQRNSPTANAIAAYEEYARAHLPRLFEEALEAAVAEQIQPIEEGLRKSLAGMVRDCQTRLAQDFLRHRSSTVSSKGDPGVRAEMLTPFYIEPLSHAEDILSINPAQISSNRQDKLQTDSGSGYASMDTSLDRNGSGLFADLRLQDNNIGSLCDSIGHGNDINGGSDFSSVSPDWVLLMENGQDSDFFGSGLYNDFT